MSNEGVNLYHDSDLSGFDVCYRNDTAGEEWRVRWIAWQRIEFCHWPERPVLIGFPNIEWQKVNIHAPFVASTATKLFLGKEGQPYVKSLNR